VLAGQRASYTGRPASGSNSSRWSWASANRIRSPVTSAAGGGLWSSQAGPSRIGDAGDGVCGSWGQVSRAWSSCAGWSSWSGSWALGRLPESATSELESVECSVS
jgi:hypothetical protein